MEHQVQVRIFNVFTGLMALMRTAHCEGVLFGQRMPSIAQQPAPSVVNVDACDVEFTFFPSFAAQFAGGLGAVFLKRLLHRW